MEGDKSQEMKGHSDSVTHVKYSNYEDQLLLSCGSDRNIKLWDVRIGQCVKSEKTKTGAKNITWNYNTNMFAYSNKDDDTIYFYDSRKFQLVKSLEFKNKINEFEFDKENKYLILAS